MIDGTPSHTAIQVAATRAAHLRFDPPPHLLEDRAAEALLGSEYEALVTQSADGAHWVLLENRLFLPLRGRWAEDRLLRAVASGVRQYVILGAGLDSFAFRQPDACAGLSIFEIDHPSTQRWKRARIQALGWSVPHNVHFSECDFVETSMIEALDAAGFDPNLPACVSWMGVIYYLERPVADRALSDLASVLAPGSQVLFDYLRPYADLAPRYAELERLSGEYLKQKGEPHVNKLRDPDVAAMIVDAGFASADLESHEGLRERYGRDLDRAIPLSERFGLVAACK